MKRVAACVGATLSKRSSISMKGSGQGLAQSDAIQRDMPRIAPPGFLHPHSDCSVRDETSEQPLQVMAYDRS
jgi:hypothetical protein